MNTRFLRTSGTVLIVIWIALCCNIGVSWSQEAPTGKATLEAQFYARHAERIKRLTHSRYSSPKLDVARDRFTIASMKKQWASAEKELDQWESVLVTEAKRLNKVEAFREEHRGLFAEVSMFPDSQGVRTSLQRVQRALDNEDYDSALRLLLQAKKEGQSLIAAEVEFRRKYKRSMDQVDEGPFNRAAEKARSDYKQAIAEFDFATASIALEELDKLREYTRENRQAIEALANGVVLNSGEDIRSDWRMQEIKAEMVAELENEDWAAARELVTRMLERKDNLLRLKRYE